MSGDMAVYRTKHPDAVGLVERYNKEHAAWLRKVERLRKKLLPGPKRNPIVFTNSWTDSQSLVGFSILSEEYRRGAEVPFGWRVDKDNHLVPLKKLKEGKALAKTLEEHKPPESARRRLPGNMPAGVMVGFGSMRCGIKDDYGDGYCYVEWGEGWDQRTNHIEEPDPEVWERVKLSDFYAMKERLEEAKV